MDETNKTRLKQMQEIDAKIEKINYDFLGIESRKKEMEDKKVEKQKEIEKLEKDKDKLTMRSEDMNKTRKIIYIVMNLQKDIKEIDSINNKIIKLKSEVEEIQNKIEIQNKLFLDTKKEKDKCLEERRKLYIGEEKQNIEETKNSNQKQPEETKEDKFMMNLNRLIELEISRYMENKSKKLNKEEEDEMQS